MTKYEQLQETAKLLGIKQTQKKEDLEAAIANTTSPKAVALLIKNNEELQMTVSLLNENIAEVNEINTKLGEAAPATDEGLVKIVELHEAQLSGKEVHTDPYQTGLANGILLAIGILRGEDVTEQLLTPLTQTEVGGVTPLTGRQRLIKEASKYITKVGGRHNLRSGLSDEQKATAMEILKKLHVENGSFEIPAE